MSFMTASAATVSGGRRVAHHLLVDGAEDRPAGAIEHLDADAIAERHERRHRLATFDGLAHTPLGDARTAGAGVAVGHRAGAHHRARLEMTGPGGMGDQLA